MTPEDIIEDVRQDLLDFIDNAPDDDDTVGDLSRAADDLASALRWIEAYRSKQ